MKNLIRKTNGNGSAAPAGYTSPFDALLGSNLSRMFDDSFWGFNDRSLGYGQSAPVNIRETDAAYELELAAPGLKKEDFKINLQRNMLTISFEQQHSNEEKEEGWIRREFSRRSFNRSFSLDDTIDANAIQASYTDGVLRLNLPKKEEAKMLNRQIEIQ